ncbi:MAG: YbbR-like domain-containing protein [Candidatus Omnitrophota bacterium]
MNLKNFLFHNLGLRTVALVLAIFAWAMITGKARSYSDRAFDVNVDYFGLPANLAVHSINPDKIRIKVKGTANVLNKLNEDDFKIRIDLSRVTEPGRYNMDTEDYLNSPISAHVVSINPRMIEIQTEQVATIEVPIKIHYTGQLKNGIFLLEKKVVPERVTIMGYKSQIQSIRYVDTIGSINLDTIEATQRVVLPLKKQKEIIKFLDMDKDTVDVYLLVENKNIKTNKK